MSMSSDGVYVTPLVKYSKKETGFGDVYKELIMFDEEVVAIQLEKIVNENIIEFYRQLKSQWKNERDNGNC